MAADAVLVCRVWRFDLQRSPDSLVLLLARQLLIQLLYRPALPAECSPALSGNARAELVPASRAELPDTAILLLLM